MAVWNELLRQARGGTGLSRQKLSRLAGVSQDTVYSYEAGRRTPHRDTLLRLTRALKLDGATTNAILEAAGLELEPSPWVIGAILRHRPLSELWEELASYSWPCLALNERFEIVAWNVPATRVAELDFATELPEPHQRNLLRIAAMRHFRARVRNWDAIVALLVSMYKNHHMGSEDLAQGSPYFQAIVEDLTRSDSDIMGRLLHLWETTPPRPQTERTTWRTEWRASDGTQLTFNCVITPWSEFDAIAINDWHPGDAATWTWLAQHA